MFGIEGMKAGWEMLTNSQYGDLPGRIIAAPLAAIGTSLGLIPSQPSASQSTTSDVGQTPVAATSAGQPTQESAQTWGSLSSGSTLAPQTDFDKVNEAVRNMVNGH